jgi:hypothetical protein
VPQLNGLTAAQRTAVGTALFNKNIKQAWDPGGATLATALFSISSGGVLAAASPANLAVASTTSLFPIVAAGGRISGKMEYSIMFPGFKTMLPVARFAQPLSGKPKFPSGFEVKIVGSGSAQKLVARVAMMSNYQSSRFDAQEAITYTAIGTTNPI